MAGGAAVLLVVGILCGSWKLKHSSGKSCKVNSQLRGNVSHHDIDVCSKCYSNISIMQSVGM